MYSLRLLFPASRLALAAVVLFVGLSPHPLAAAAVINYPLTGDSVFDVNFLYEVSGDGQYVVFRRASPSEIYSVPITGSATPTLISGLPGYFVLSPTSQQIVFTAAGPAPGVSELYSAPIGGGAPMQLNGVFGHAQGVNFSQIQITPDGNYVVYRADQDTDEMYELYSVPINGGAVVKLNAPLSAGEDVGTEYKLSPDSTRVIYLGGVRLYSVPVTGGAATPYALNPVDGRATLSPDSASVVFRARATPTDPIELYRGSILGGAVERLGDPLSPGTGVQSFLISPDSSRVIYKITPLVEELYQIPLSGGSSTPLSNAALDGRGITSFGLSGNGQYVVYRAANGLFSVSLSGGIGVQLNAPLEANWALSFPMVTPDNSRVIYPTSHTQTGAHQLFSVPISGGSVITLTETPLFPGNLSLLFSPDGHELVYLGEQETDGVPEVFSILTTGGSRTKLSGPMVSGGGVTSLIFRGSRLVYLADQRTDGVRELFVSYKDLPNKVYLPLVRR